MKKEVLDKIMITKGYGAEDATSFLELSQFASFVVRCQNPDLVKSLEHPLTLQEWNDARKMLDIKHNELVNKFIEELHEYSQAEVSRIKKKYTVKLKLEDLEKDF